MAYKNYSIIVFIVTITQLMISVAFARVPCANATVGGNGEGLPCVFPFRYYNRTYSSCVEFYHTKPWCAVTEDYDEDKRWGECIVDCKSPSCPVYAVALDSSGSIFECHFPFEFENQRFYNCTGVAGSLLCGRRQQVEELGDIGFCMPGPSGTLCEDSVTIDGDVDLVNISTTTLHQVLQELTTVATKPAVTQINDESGVTNMDHDLDDITTAGATIDNSNIADAEVDADNTDDSNTVAVRDMETQTPPVYDNSHTYHHMSTAHILQTFQHTSQDGIANELEPTRTPSSSDDVTEGNFNIAINNDMGENYNDTTHSGEIVGITVAYSANNNENNVTDTNVSGENDVNTTIQPVSQDVFTHFYNTSLEQVSQGSLDDGVALDNSSVIIHEGNQNSSPEDNNDNPISNNSTIAMEDDVTELEDDINETEGDFDDFSYLYVSVTEEGQPDESRMPQNSGNDEGLFEEDGDDENQVDLTSPPTLTLLTALMHTAIDIDSIVDMDIDVNDTETIDSNNTITSSNDEELGNTNSTGVNRNDTHNSVNNSSDFQQEMGNVDNATELDTNIPSTQDTNITFSQNDADAITNDDGANIIRTSAIFFDDITEMPSIDDENKNNVENDLSGIDNSTIAHIGEEEILNDVESDNDENTSSMTSVYSNNHLTTMMPSYVNAENSTADPIQEEDNQVEQEYSNVACVSSCLGVEDGDYQSCAGCGVYASCSAEQLVDNRPCPAGLVWDDHAKYCDFSSTTCVNDASDGGTTTMSNDTE